MRLMPGVVVAFLSVTSASAQLQSPADVDGGRIAGYVVTAYAEIVTDATVTLARVNDHGVGVQTRTTRTDGSGAFSFAQLPEGRYRVLASKPGYTSRQFPDPTQPALTFDLGPAVDLAADAQALDVQVVLHRTASITGRIIRPDGSAASNVQVQAAIRSGTLPGHRSSKAGPRANSTGDMKSAGSRLGSIRLVP